ncbi:MAG TPA: UbiD family decarboxylase [Desulfobacterales bacterium]|nr:UbiD family decarboxylase [Desulfobacterales bacterium]
MGSFPFKSLREWMEFLEEKGELVRNKEEVDIWGDISAISRKIAREGGPAIIHENIQGYPGWRVFSDGLTTRRRQLWALDLPEVGTLEAVLERLSKEPMKPKRVEWGPCKEIKLFGDDIDLTKFPISFTGEYEATPHITAGISFLKDPETGWTNAGIRRFQLIGKNKLCNLILPFQHEAVIFSKYMKQGVSTPISIVIGADPIVYLSCMMPAPDQFDEMDYWGVFTGEALEVVKSETNDIWVPATSEIVIEGEMAPYERELEGPFPEFPGYYSGLRMCPVIHVKAITMREDAIYQNMYMGLPPSEGHNTGAFVYEVEIYRQVKPLIPEIKDVGVLSTWSLTTAVSIDKTARRRTPGLEKRLAMAVKSVKAGVMIKNLFIVDDDVDVRNLHDVLWSLSVKFQPAKDITVVTDVPGIFLDPSEPWVGHGGTYSGHSSFGIFNCTEKLAPYDEGYKRGVALPPPYSLEKIEKNISKYGL